ncbi:MAG: hypothetical protein CL849_01760 [Crocinitomicaceae bacterium]|nr:hypothetical protein [Crocinitomicaceae bacterium]
MWKQIFFSLLLASPTALLSAEVQEGASDGNQCIPDSTLFHKNARWWYPGEPLKWANPTLLDSLLKEDFDAFSILTESPRNQTVRRRIHCMRSPEGKSALFIVGDQRYITYDLETLENASISNVVGHSDGAIAYWYDSTLYFQNGRANWFLHAQRLFHSQQTWEMEQSQTNAPPAGAEHAFVFVLDSASYFIMLNGDLEFMQEPTRVISLPHGGMDWIPLGKLNPSITRLRSRTVPWHLRDYVVAMHSGSALIIRNSDLQFKLVPSRIAATIQSEFGDGNVPPNLWLGWKGDSLIYSSSSKQIVEVVTDIAQGGKWAPLILPADFPTESSKGDQDKELWAWLLASVMTVAFVVLLLDRALRGQKTMFIPVAPSEEKMARVAISKETQVMLLHSGRQMGADAFDHIIDLDKVESPETRRSRRSRYIQLVNAEAQARFGRNLIERVRSTEDKRIMMYKIVRPDQEEE